eukprot:623906-Rhodomonas_salina.1
MTSARRVSANCVDSPCIPCSGLVFIPCLIPCSGQTYGESNTLTALALSVRVWRVAHTTGADSEER